MKARLHCYFLTFYIFSIFGPTFSMRKYMYKHKIKNYNANKVIVMAIMILIYLLVVFKSHQQDHMSPENSVKWHIIIAIKLLQRKHLPYLLGTRKYILSNLKRQTKTDRSCPQLFFFFLNK